MERGENMEEVDLVSFNTDSRNKATIHKIADETSGVVCYVVHNDFTSYTDAPLSISCIKLINREEL